MLRVVRELYLFRSPDSFPDGLVVFRALPDRDDLLDLGDSLTLSDVRDMDEKQRGVVIEVLNGGLRVWPAGTTQPRALVDGAVAYVFTGVTERTELGDPEAIALPQGLKAVPNPVGYASAFAPPTFWNLEDALTFYASGLAERSTCKILRTAWAKDSSDRRLVLVNHPEVIMRESLAQHLRSTLRDQSSCASTKSKTSPRPSPLTLK